MLRVSLAQESARSRFVLNQERNIMSMTKLFYGLAALPLVAGVASAEPPKADVAKKAMQLSEQQMDKVTAGWDLRIFELYNSGADWVSVYETAPAPTTAAGGFFGSGNAITCPPEACYLNINNRALSVASMMFAGPNTTPAD
jgi:hypothetical protein